ncbi:response regulator [Magnetovibrio sp.]|uniref:response regulator n=1 Tax=Magnetovibrio sp. TaxID=2024836 RepID=UPI002F942A0C
MVKILVIDDDQDILDFAKVCLGDRHEIATALDGEAGLYACETTKFDLIITDIFMPFRDGLDIIREALKLYPDIKIIAMTARYGKAHTNYLKAAEVIGAAAQLRKPFTAEDLISAVDQVMDQTVQV